MMRTREEQIKPWGYISPFAIEMLRYSARCDLTITREKTHNITMPLYTEEQLREAERRAEQRVRAEIGRDSERLDWLEKLPFADVGRLSNGWEICINHVRHWDMQPTLREAIDAAMETK